jgi:hypothetical protein
MRNSSKIMANKDHESLANLSRSGQNQMSFSSNSMNKRVSSAKNKRDKDKKERKVVYERIPSKKSLKNE